MKDNSDITLVCGDCLRLMYDIPENSVDMVCCDMPYGTTACKWDTVLPLDMLWYHYKRICRDNAAIILNASQPFTTTLINSNIKWFKYQWVWQKPQGVDPFMAKKRPLNNIEDVLVFMNKQSIYNPQKTEGKSYHVVRDKTPRVHEVTGQTMIQTETVNTGWRLPTRILPFNQERGSHPTQKPVTLIEYLIKTYTNEGDTVLDNCMGSGTTGVACVNTNRRFVGIELDKQYFEIAKERIENTKKVEAIS